MYQYAEFKYIDKLFVYNIGTYQVSLYSNIVQVYMYRFNGVQTTNGGGYTLSSPKLINCSAISFLDG